MPQETYTGVPVVPGEEERKDTRKDYSLTPQQQERSLYISKRLRLMEREKGKHIASKRRALMLYDGIFRLDGNPAGAFKKEEIVAPLARIFVEAKTAEEVRAFSDFQFFPVDDEDDAWRAELLTETVEHIRCVLHVGRKFCQVLIVTCQRRSIRMPHQRGCSDGVQPLKSFRRVRMPKVVSTVLNTDLGFQSAESATHLIPVPRLAVGGPKDLSVWMLPAQLRNDPKGLVVEINNPWVLLSLRLRRWEDNPPLIELTVLRLYCDCLLWPTTRPPQKLEERLKVLPRVFENVVELVVGQNDFSSGLTRTSRRGDRIKPNVPLIGKPSERCSYRLNGTGLRRIRPVLRIQPRRQLLGLQIAYRQANSNEPPKGRQVVVVDEVGGLRTVLLAPVQKRIQHADDRLTRDYHFSGSADQLFELVFRCTLLFFPFDKTDLFTLAVYGLMRIPPAVKGTKPRFRKHSKPPVKQVESEGSRGRERCNSPPPFGATAKSSRSKSSRGEKI